jgi:hypothetical protein
VVDTGLEEGDLYRVLDTGAILNLNWARGLQVIDISNPAIPVLRGRLPLAGRPVETYVEGDRVIVLVDDRYGYERTGTGLDLEQTDNLAVLLVDIADRSAPRLLAEVPVPGYFPASRLSRKGEHPVLFVASTGLRQVDGVWDRVTTVTSLALSGDQLVERDTLDLVGELRAVHAAEDMLLVARGYFGGTDEVTLIDISDPSGILVQRGTVATAAEVQSQFHMDYRDGLLRVFSSFPRTTFPNYLQIWNTSNPDAPALADQEIFGEAQDLHGAIFLDDRAFAVTYQNVDPFHAFAIDANGDATQISEFEVSGWNTFFRPVLDQTRLLGIGIDDANGNRLAVSLYDITDLANPEPLLTREEVHDDDSGRDWSEAIWDRRAFTVLEGAVSVQAATGETETGLVLLPFTSEDDEDKRVTGVQMFTYSATTLTRRGLMLHDDDVRRSFAAGGGVAASLSEQALTLYLYSDLDAPIQLGSLEVLPSYSNVLAYEGFRVRLRHPSPSTGVAPAVPPVLEIVSRTGDLDSAPLLASFEVPRGAALYKMSEGRLLVAARLGSDASPPNSAWLQVYDVSNPQSPVLAGEYTATDLPALGPAWRPDGRYQPAIYTTADVVAILGNEYREVVGAQKVCRIVAAPPECDSAEFCQYVAGQRYCRSIDDGPEFCEGGFAICTETPGANSCAPVPTDDVSDVLETTCTTGAWSRPNRTFEVHVVDFSDPANPTRSPVIELAEADEGVNALGHGDTLYVTVKRRVAVAGDPRPYVRFFVYPVDLSQGSKAVRGPAINVPGEPLAVHGDTLYTRDMAWTSEFIEFAVARLRLDGGVARLEKYEQIPYDYPMNIAIDDSGQAVLQLSRRWMLGYVYVEPKLQLRVLRPSAAAGDLAFDPVFSDAMPHSHMALMTARGGRAYVRALGGVLTLDLEDAGGPHVESFLPHHDWYPSIHVDGDEVLISGHPSVGLDLYDAADPSLRVPLRSEAAE